MLSPDFVAQRIKTLAKAKGVTTGEMFCACGLNKNTLSTMQTRGFLPRAETLDKIADYFGCSIDHLLGRTETAPWAEPLVSAYESAPELTQQAVCGVLGIPHVQPGVSPIPLGESE